MQHWHLDESHCGQVPSSLSLCLFVCKMGIVIAEMADLDT